MLCFNIFILLIGATIRNFTVAFVPKSNLYPKLSSSSLILHHKFSQYGKSTPKQLFSTGSSSQEFDSAPKVVDTPSINKPSKFASFLTLLKSKTLKKMIPLGLMLFFILFNYTILRNTKDVLIVTAPNGGADIIPFLKTYVNLPAAIGFTVLYSSLCNNMSQANVFYAIMGPFIAFFGLFASLIYPNRMFLHPHLLADWLGVVLPSFMLPLISIFRNWTYAVFYVMAELWGSVVVSLLFWGFANEVATVSEAKTYYPLFGLLANVALIFSGQYVNFVSSLRSTLAVGADQWGYSLKWLMAAVVGGGGAILSLFTYMQQKILSDPECVPCKDISAATTTTTDATTTTTSSTTTTTSSTTTVVAPKKKKTKMTLGESYKFLSKSKYIRDLALLVICYGMSINIVEVTWKSKLQLAYPNPNDYSAFMGNFASATGVVTLALMLIGRFVLNRFGWGVAALIPPVTLISTGAIFFSLSLFPEIFKPVTARLGTTPLILAVMVGAVQNILSKGSKYSFFDPCKEMAYIPLDSESKTKGKAAVDVIGNPLGKSGGSLLQQILIACTGSLAASTPYLGGFLGIIILVWINAAKSLAKQFAAKSEELESKCAVVE